MKQGRPNWRIRSVPRQGSYPVVHRDRRNVSVAILSFLAGFVVGVFLSLLILALWHGPF